MRQRDLERALQRVPPHPAPRAELEQYATPATIAADVLMRAFALGDVADKSVLDLGCGTGVLGLGAALLDARHVTGVDVDARALVTAREAARALDMEDCVRFEEADVHLWEPQEPFDTCVQNPPFGAQKRGADRPFLVKALNAARVTYTFHLTETGEWVIAFAKGHGGTLTHAWDYAFPLKHTYRHQTKAVVRVPVTVFRFERA